jgi:hypothetical protein
VYNNILKFYQHRFELLRYKTNDHHRAGSLVANIHSKYFKLNIEYKNLHIKNTLHIIQHRDCTDESPDCKAQCLNSFGSLEGFVDFELSVNIQCSCQIKMSKYYTKYHKQHIFVMSNWENNHLYTDKLED